MRLFAHFASALIAFGSLAPYAVQAAPNLHISAAPQAQADVDDSDLLGEETLNELMQIEYDKEAWSMGAAIGLSLLPGGGYGLLYAEKPAQSAVPFTIFAVGAGVGLAYILGAFDSRKQTSCYHVRDGKVSRGECDIAKDKTQNHQKDPRADESLKSPKNQYWNTAGDYQLRTTGENFDGTKTGIIILASAYVASTLVGAIWAGSTVSDHNEQLRKDIESTTFLAPLRNVRPVAYYNGDEAHFGFAFEF